MPRHWDPEDLISTKWLHNKGWIPVSATFMTSFTMCHISMFVQLWNESRYDGSRWRDDKPVIPLLVSAAAV
nr:WPE palindromic element domain-containing protein [Wolbachia endosymbiont (group A) of Anomoia purmunda]